MVRFITTGHNLLWHAKRRPDGSVGGCRWQGLCSCSIQIHFYSLADIDHSTRLKRHHCACLQAAEQQASQAQTDLAEQKRKITDERATLTEERLELEQQQEQLENERVAFAAKQEQALVR